MKVYQLTYKKNGKTEVEIISSKRTAKIRKRATGGNLRTVNKFEYNEFPDLDTAKEAQGIEFVSNVKDTKAKAFRSFGDFLATKDIRIYKSQVEVTDWMWEIDKEAQGVQQ